MWLWDDDARVRAILARGHDVTTRVDVLHSGWPVYQLEVVSGLVSIQADRPVRSHLGCTLVDPTGKLTKGDVDDLLDPYECEIAPWRGVQYGPWQLPTRALAPLGVFGLTGRNVTDDGNGLTIRLAGQDRAIGYQVPLSRALAIPGGTPVEEAIIRLLGAVNPRLSLLAMRTGYTCGPLLYPPDADVWGEAQELAVSVGAQLYHDRSGQCVFAPAGPPSRIPVTGYAEGDGRLLTVDRAEDSDTIRNVVVAESPDGLIRVEVADDDPTSPTYAGGRYGRRPAETIKNQHFGSVQQAQQAAAARLIYELGRSETVKFTAVPDPGLDVDDITTAHHPEAGLNQRGLAVAAIDMPLGYDQPMTVTCRRSVLAQDGTVLDEEAA